MLALTSAGDAWSSDIASVSVGVVAGVSVSTGVSGETSALTPEWWRRTSDPVLETLVDQGLESSQEIACRVSGLQHSDFLAARETKRFGTRLGRLFGADQKTRAETRARTHDERVQRIVERRIRVSRQVALAYVEVRRLQQEVAIRGGARGQYKDNVEVAQFRREAGLASAIDGALARSQDQAAQGELEYAQGRLNDAMSQLASLTGNTPDALAHKLETTNLPIDALAAAIPPRMAPPSTANPAPDEYAQREARLVKALEEARRTVRDARGAYRQGAGEYTTLYVAEAAVAAVQLALMNARASRVTAALELLSRQDDAWARKDLDTVVTIDRPAIDPTITVIADCD